MDARIEPARPADRPRVLELLAAAELPDGGLDACQDHLLVARDGDRLVGCAALEPHGPDAVLRSVAVATDRRGTGLGVALVEAAVARARQHDLRALYLLTETAGRFFPRFGFRVCERDAAPTAIRQSIEFASLCPASAVAMCLSLMPREETPPCATDS